MLEWMVRNGDPTPPRQGTPGGPGGRAARDGDGQHGGPHRCGETEGTQHEAAHCASGRPLALGKDHERMTGSQQPYGLAGRPGIAAVDVDGESPEPPDEPSEQRDAE